jgi:hypothetical protein
MPDDRASEETAQSLHQKLAEVLLKGLDGRTEIMKDGEVVELPPDPRMVANAIKFLKDNGITGLPIKGSDIDKLTEKLKAKGKVLPFPILDPHEEQ